MNLKEKIESFQLEPVNNFYFIIFFFKLFLKGAKWYFIKVPTFAQ